MKIQLFLFCLFFSFVNYAQNEKKRATHYNLEKKVALQHYDPVAYFKNNKAQKGVASISTSYLGVLYYFSSIENKKEFINNPSKYEPQFGGWCAFAMGDSGEKVSVNPETFKIIDNKLYLFYNAYFNNTLKSWNKNQNSLLTKANINWNTIYNEKI